MELTLGLLADFANKSADGKLNILGVFNRIWADVYPCVHPEMKLVLRFELHPAEASETKKLQIQLRTDEGRQLMDLAGEMPVAAPATPVPRGEMIHVDQILGLNNFPIEAPGRYEFVILSNGEVKGTVPFTAAARPARPEP
jgi:hypothetical protein